MFGSLGIWEIMLILLVVMVLFGANKLPQIGKGLGKAITNFKRSVKEPDSLEESDDESENKKDE